MRIRQHEIDESVWNSLRICQQEACDVAFNYLNQRYERASALLSLPTGAGKTGVIAMISLYTRKQKVLVLTHRRGICDQLLEEISGEFFNSIGKPDKVKHKKTFENLQSPGKNGIYVSTFQAVQRLEKNQLEELAKRIDLIIIDEGHSEPSPVWSESIRSIRAHKIIVTATPYRNDLFQFDIDPNRSYIYTFKKALKDKILVKPRFSKSSKTGAIDKVEQNLKEKPNTLCIVKCRTFEDVDYYYKEFSKRFKTLGVHENYKKSSKAGTTSTVPKRLKTMDFEVIVHQKKIDEGIDIPNAKTLLLTYEVGSGRELVQTIGRIVRRYKDIKPDVIEFEGYDNEDNWLRFIDFDQYLSKESNANEFLSSLDTSLLIKNYLSIFPEMTYFAGDFKRRLDLNAFDPVKSLHFPIASVCFVEKKEAYDKMLFIDHIFWSQKRDGELVKYIDDALGFDIIVSITFNSSKYLKHELFVQPKFEVFVLKNFKDFVAIFDSRGRDYSSSAATGLGKPVEIDKLLKLASQAEVTRTKQANTITIGSSEMRPESISLRGRNLESTVSTQGNSGYALSTLTVDNLTELGDVKSSFYLGMGSGRVSDKKHRRLSLPELETWMSNIERQILSKRSLQSNFIQSYAKPVTEVPNLEPDSVLLDFSEFDFELIKNEAGLELEVTDDFVFYEYEGFIVPFADYSEFKVSLDSFEGELYFYQTDAPDRGANPGFSDSAKRLVIEQLNRIDKRVLYSNGLSYTNGRFFKIRLPSEDGFDLNDTRLGGMLVPLDSLHARGLSEKDEKRATNDEFGDRSIFWLLDKLRLASDPSLPVSELGDFYHHIPGVDLILCADMGTEPADFILSSRDRLVFAHVKCGDAQSPNSAAGAIAEVGGQAIKNIEHLITYNDELRFGNDTRLSKPWPDEAKLNFVRERVRLLDGKRFFATNERSRRDAVKRVNEEIARRRRSPSVQKEVWIIVGRGFSRSDFLKQMSKGNKGKSESLQAFQMMDSWLATLASLDVSLKIFTSP